MTCRRLSARAADARALLVRFAAASEQALDALERNDAQALERALDVREELQHEMERVAREISMLESRFADGRGHVVVDAALDRLLAPLAEVADRAESLQRRLAERVDVAAASIARELSRLNAGSPAAYAGPLDPAQRLDVRL